MLKIALTGLPGSGKTTVAGLFKALGAEIINADSVCHSLLIPCEKAYHEILNYFGNECLNPDGTLNKNFLRHRLIFSDKDKKTLENILHPKIYTKIMKKIKELEKKECKIVIIEIPLLFEVGWEKEFDFIVVIDTNEKTCISRLKNKGLSEKEAKGLISLHLPLEEKKKYADFIINNMGNLEQVKEQVKYIWKKLLNLTP